LTTGIGVLGSGFMGHTWAEVAANHAKSTRLIAMAGGRRAPGVAQEYGVPVDSSYEALLARSDVDAVVITTPPDGHRDQVVAAAKAGKHVLVEKPMCITAADAQEMVDVCDAADVRLAVVSQHRWRDAPVAAKKIIDSGRLGQIRMARVESTAAGWWDLEARQDQWKKDPAKQTAFSSDAAHGHDIPRRVLGSDAIRAYTQRTTYSGFVPGDSNMKIYTWANGVLSDYWMSYELPEPGLGPMTFLLTGSEAMLKLDMYGKVQVSKPDGSWELAFEQHPFDPLNAVDPKRLRAYAAQLEDLVAAIDGHHDPLVSGREGRNTMDMLEGADRSAKRNEAVALPLTD
jgi:UDP-N-acetyl-2-amino-2-deoxyglucuronate dehydrogenase